MFYWMEASHRPYLHSRGGDWRCDSLCVGGHLAFATPSHLGTLSHDSISFCLLPLCETGKPAIAGEGASVDPPFLQL
jgi:hypothetical protein